MNKSGFSMIGAIILLAASSVASFYVVNSVWKPT
tara:strand:- start:7422 stop:7523 length:102 start_codon:yes stop_codon:yes gene_type:complete